MPKAKAGSPLEQAPKERMPSRIEAMLAKPGTIPESDSEEWAYEIKWDGVRVLGYANHGRWRMMSRRQERSPPAIRSSRRSPRRSVITLPSSMVRSWPSISTDGRASS